MNSDGPVCRTVAVRLQIGMGWSNHISKISLHSAPIKDSIRLVRNYTQYMRAMLQFVAEQGNDTLQPQPTPPFQALWISVSTG